MLIDAHLKKGRAGRQGGQGWGASASILAPVVQCWTQAKGEHEEDRTGGRP